MQTGTLPSSSPSPPRHPSPKVPQFFLTLTSHACSSIPLVSVVDSFDVFHTGQGSQGLLQRPSKQELETVFGTTKEDEIVEIVLTKGTIKSSDAPHQWTSVNDQRCVDVSLRRACPALLAQTGPWSFYTVLILLHSQVWQLPGLGRLGWQERPRRPVNGFVVVGCAFPALLAFMRLC